MQSLFCALAFQLSAAAVAAAAATGPACSSIAAKYSGHWSAPPKSVPTQKLVDGPILGNGDLGVVLGGPPGQLTFYIGLN